MGKAYFHNSTVCIGGIRFIFYFYFVLLTNDHFPIDRISDRFMETNVKKICQENGGYLGSGATVKDRHRYEAIQWLKFQQEIQWIIGNDWFNRKEIYKKEYTMRKSGCKIYLFLKKSYFFSIFFVNAKSA